jgi:hypothetical protein
MKSMRIRWAGHVASMGKERSVQGFGGKTRRKETTRRTEALIGGWDKNVSWRDWLGGVEWTQLAQDRGPWMAVVNVVMNFRVLAPRI